MKSGRAAPRTAGAGLARAQARTPGVTTSRGPDAVGALQGAAGNHAVADLLRPSSHRVPQSSRAAAGDLPPVVAATVAGAGSQLAGDVRDEMGSHFAHDFGGVRVHTDPDAARSAESVGAAAYTVGSHVVFAPGQFDPRGVGGRRLLAHELAHVVQQSRGGGPAPGFDTDSRLEHGADRAASTVVRDSGVVDVAGASAPGLARQASNTDTPAGVHVTNRFTASAELLRRAKAKAESGDVAGALKLVDGVVGFTKAIKYRSWETLRSLNGLARTDVEMIAGIGVSAVEQLAARLREGPPPDQDFWARSFREYLYARPALEVLSGDTPVAQSKFAQDINKGTNTALTAMAAVGVAAIALPILIEGAPLVAEIAMQATPRLTILATENPALVHLLE